MINKDILKLNIEYILLAENCIIYDVYILFISVYTISSRINNNISWMLQSRHRIIRLFAASLLFFSFDIFFHMNVLIDHQQRKARKRNPILEESANGFENICKSRKEAIHWNQNEECNRMTWCWNLYEYEMHFLNLDCQLVMTMILFHVTK